jgi:ribosomal protein L32
MRNTNLSLPRAISAAVRWGFTGLAWTDITHFLKVKRIAIQLEENLAPSIYRSSKKKKKKRLTYALKYETVRPCPSIFSRATNHSLCLFSF